MPQVSYNLFNALRHSLERAVEVMRDEIVRCGDSNCEHKDSALRVRKALYYHFLNILDDMNIILTEIPDGQ